MGLKCISHQTPYKNFSYLCQISKSQQKISTTLRNEMGVIFIHFSMIFLGISLKLK